MQRYTASSNSEGGISKYSAILAAYFAVMTIVALYGPNLFKLTSGYFLGWLCFFVPVMLIGAVVIIKKALLSEKTHGVAHSFFLAFMAMLAVGLTLIALILIENGSCGGTACAWGVGLLMIGTMVAVPAIFVLTAIVALIMNGLIRKGAIRRSEKTIAQSIIQSDKNKLFRICVLVAILLLTTFASSIYYEPMVGAVITVILTVLMVILLATIVRAKAVSRSDAYLVAISYLPMILGYCWALFGYMLDKSFLWETSTPPILSPFNLAPIVTFAIVSVVLAILYAKSKKGKSSKLSWQSTSLLATINVILMVILCVMVFSKG